MSDEENKKKSLTKDKGESDMMDKVIESRSLTSLIVTARTKISPFNVVRLVFSCTDRFRRLRVEAEQPNFVRQPTQREPLAILTPDDPNDLSWNFQCRHCEY